MTHSTRSFDDRYRALLICSRVNAVEALAEVDEWRKEEGRRLSVVDRARLRRLRAHCLHTLARMEPARREYEKSFDLFRQRKMPEEMARSAIGWIDCLAHLGRTREARALARRTERLLPRRATTVRARLRANLANALYLAGEVDAAEKLLRSAIATLDRAGYERDAALCRFNLGQILLARGKVEAARRIFLRAREVFEDSGFRQSALQAAYGEASARLMAGEWSEGFSQLETLRKKLDRLGDERAAAAVRWELSRFLGGLGAFEAAEAEAAQALEVHRKMGLARETALLSSLRARWLIELGRRMDARVLLERALRHWRSAKRTLPAARVQVELARLHLSRGDASAALRRLSPLQAILDRKDPQGAAVRCRGLRARAHLELGHPARALKMAEDSFAQARDPLWSTQRPAMALDCARAALMAGEGALARRWLRRFARRLEELQSQLGSRVLQRLRAGSHEELLREAVELALRVDARGTLAFRLVTRLSSAGLLAEITRGSFQLSPELRTAVALLRDRLLEGGEEESGDDPRVRGLRLRLADLQEQPPEWSVGGWRAEGKPAASPGKPPGEDRYRVLYYRERGNWAAYLQSPRGRIRRVVLPGVDRALQDHWIPLRLLLESAAVRPPRRRRRFLERTTAEALEALCALRRVVFEPLELDATRLELIPHGSLHELPLEAIVNASTENPDGRVEVFRSPHPRWDPPAGRRMRRALILDDGRRASRTESEDLGRIFRGKGWTVRRGSRRALLEEAKGRQGLIHLAAHGVHHRAAWFLNGIRLEDGWVGFEQIPERVARGGMVYLDACESGLGLAGDGVEAMGWVAAGLGAGAKEMVLTLWKIDDESARSFATAFHRHFAAGQKASVALREAQNQLRRDRPHPFHWAGFTLVAS